ncbi:MULTISPECIES: 50S ribosomal protein L33 [Chengkuizengella]|uniref:Large ribosomal subunit protein bL33 n=2 Tax=Chengkuizengella TaxID=2026172 RepID=A0A6N9Q6T0_9BACL|nr:MULTISPECIES: 50S ribosomal protein L33 [Chengkuizengella]MDP5276865.1 50S ribosomal protein L33 [Chengkuizengella sp. 2205SS18-9]NBI30334.1 50S ribosomal protein L33 [Chengkuizengella marina]
MRVIMTLACTVCKRRNYTSNKNKRNHPDRMEMKKYCSHCNQHTVHRETR